MIKTSLFITLLLISYLFSNSFDQLKDREVEVLPREYNPVLTTSLSIVPGAGQLYTRHFTKGFIFLGTEALLGSQAVLRWKWYHDAFDTHEKAVED
jgi:hypothetical protein